MPTVTASPNVRAKAVEYLTSGRVRVDYAYHRSFSALVTGSAPAPYAVLFYDGGWHCTCPASRECAHILACRAIWAPQETS